MSTPIFPQAISTSHPWGRGLAWNIEKTPVESTTVQTTVTGRRAAIANYASPLWHWKCQFTVLRDIMALGVNVSRGTAGTKYTGYQEVLAFLLARRGKHEPFFWTDPTDGTVTTQTIYTTTPAGVTDYQMVRTVGSGSYTFTEPVRGINATATHTIYVNASPVSAVTLNNPRDGWIHFTTAPTTGATITADFSYYHLVALSKDGTTFRTFAKDFWEVVDFELDTVVL